ncbi:hypothetical protein [Ornithinimicrobium sp. INDO-MA30-4]|uniref:hypothetical protein n=1 Tax=Ornithinimicrobium sp. INDO-MA30-4 TaxID=2908651 RepID=UPI001F2D3659|nr:hypothetical protein [Ornithinimicrobium sp. INDO-MA30-4]UJH71308.1 hypothetical protein L0A91_05915 [Ornithinimicrobium sp. INDO-MA30-4]
MASHPLSWRSVSRRSALTMVGMGFWGAAGLTACGRDAVDEAYVEVSGTSPSGRRDVYQQLAEAAVPAINELWGPGLCHVRSKCSCQRRRVSSQISRDWRVNEKKCPRW